VAHQLSDRHLGCLFDRRNVLLENGCQRFYFRTIPIGRTTMNVAQNTASTQAAALVGSFTNTSTVNIYNGTIPATPETAITSQTLLATITLPASSAFTQTNGVMTAAAITSPTIGATGTANFFRWVKSDGTTVIGDGYCGVASGLGAWATNTAYTANTSYVTANGNTYRCRTSGTSATTGSGPALKDMNIGDGTAAWDYVDMLLGTLSLVSGAQLSISSFTYTVPSV
jgi:hypothetical protein